MAKWYGSFLVRCWHLADDEQRLEIEHIQSGARVRVATIAAAVAWMSARDGDEARPPEPAGGGDPGATKIIEDAAARQQEPWRKR